MWSISNNECVVFSSTSTTSFPTDHTIDRLESKLSLRFPHCLRNLLFKEFTIITNETNPFLFPSTEFEKSTFWAKVL